VISKFVNEAWVLVFRLTEKGALRKSASERQLALIWVTVGIGSLRVMPLKNFGCHGIRCSERRTLLRSVNEVPSCFLNFCFSFDKTRYIRYPWRYIECCGNNDQVRAEHYWGHLTQFCAHFWRYHQYMRCLPSTKNFEWCVTEMGKVSATVWLGK
jgi:hypothetical protein